MTQRGSRPSLLPQGCWHSAGRVTVDWSAFASAAAEGLKERAELMDVAAFIGSTPWLRGSDEHGEELSPDAYAVREQLGLLLGSPDWYLGEDGTLVTMLEVLEQANTGLLDELVQACGDEAAGVGLLWAIFSSYRFDVPVWDENYGLFYRYDKLTGEYEWASEADSAAWMSQAEADAQMAAWAEASQAEAAQYAAESVAEWDENWGMFYRLGATGAYEYAHAVRPFDKDSGCGGNWLTEAQASADYSEKLSQYEAARTAQWPAAEALPAAAPGRGQGNQADAGTGRAFAAGAPAEPGPGEVPVTAELAESLQKLREFIVEPSIENVLSQLPDELKERIGLTEVESLVRRLVVRETSRIAASSTETQTEM
jgi:hypothetical protein